MLENGISVKPAPLPLNTDADTPAAKNPLPVADKLPVTLTLPKNVLPVA